MKYYQKPNKLFKNYVETKKEKKITLSLIGMFIDEANMEIKFNIKRDYLRQADISIIESLKSKISKKVSFI